MAVTFDDGVVMAGDRRATMGHLIANRTIDKVFVADETSLVGIAGVGRSRDRAGRALPGGTGALREDRGCPVVPGGPRQPARRYPRNLGLALGLAMPGMTTVPRRPSAGPSPARSAGRGRIFSYDVAGGCYEEHDLRASARAACSPAAPSRSCGRRVSTRTGRCAVAVEALYDAADDDTATGGPDLARAIYPTCGIADADGARLVGDELLRRDGRRPVDQRRDAAGSGSAPVSIPFYVSPEQLTKDRAEFARKGIARGRPVCGQLRRGRPVRRREPLPSLHKIAEIHDRIGFAGVGKYHEFETLRVAGVRYADMRGYAYDRRDVRRGPGGRLRPDPGCDVRRREQAVRGGDPAGPGRRDARTRRDLPGRLRRVGAGRTRVRRGRWRPRPGHRGPARPAPTGSADGRRAGAGRDGVAARRPAAGAPGGRGAGPRQATTYLPSPRRRRRAPARGPGGSSAPQQQPADPTRTGEPERGPADLRAGDRVRRDLYAGRRQGAHSGRGGALPVPGHRGGLSEQQRLPRQRGPALPGCGQPPGVRDRRMRHPARPARPGPGRRADHRGPDRPGAAADVRETASSGDIYLFSNNIDSAGNSYGCHENYLVGRTADFSTVSPTP